MNPYLKRMKELEDEEVMRKICRATVPSLEAAASAYASLYPAIGSSITTTLGSLFRPDVLLSRVRSNSAPPKSASHDQELQPIPQAVTVLPVYEFMAGNAIFRRTLLSDLDSLSTCQSSWIGTFLTLTSWILTNASSSSSGRTLSYASLVLEMILVLMEDEHCMDILTSRIASNVQLCSQRQPRLPALPPGRPLLCDILDCCNLWLRHNLHRRLATQSYSKCVWICHRIVWYLQRERIRLDYHWKELWVSVIGLFSFVATKFDTLITTGGIGQLILDGLALFEAAIVAAEAYLPSAHAVHELVYELVRNSTILEKQEGILKSLEVPPHKEEALRYIVDVTSYYNKKISATGANLKAASDAMRIIVQEVERNGLHRPENAAEKEPRLRAEEVLDFARYACGDTLAGA
ncbi:hypothetical protein FA13DRAFT_1751440 [Coprinellus micaceus]|uniref:Armadillo-like helical domain-containing protein n=1 Tax=Coprinellus micaceus TaxID=71717 RepID=A0A4Y7TXJ4_COPMI|nr:hypothetical protein FA13DRAFT_1751440 [Coprinellus micaceus]